MTVFENLAVDQDLLISIADGMNAHHPEDAGFVPNVNVSNGHLSDRSATEELAEGDPAREQALYLARADAANGCDYPRSCAVRKSAALERALPPARATSPLIRQRLKSMLQR